EASTERELRLRQRETERGREGRQRRDRRSEEQTTRRETGLAWIERDRLAGPRIAAGDRLERDQTLVVVVDTHAAAYHRLAGAEQMPEESVILRRVPREACVGRRIDQVALVGMRPQIDLRIGDAPKLPRLEKRRGRPIEVGEGRTRVDPVPIVRS